MMESQQLLDQSLQRGAYVDADEVRSVAQAKAPEWPQAFAAPPNIFELWDQSTADLKKLVAGMAHLVPHTVRHDTAQAELAIQTKASDRVMLMRLPPERLFGFSMAPPQQAVAPRPAH